MAQPGDLVVLTPTDVEAMWQQVLDFRAAPVRSLDVEVDRTDGQPDAWRRSA
jgi:cyanophycin synthetase